MNRFFVKEKDFYKLLIQLALPVVFQNMITIGVNIMDTVMLGSYGEVQLAASSLANDFINLFQFLAMGIGSGAAVLTAQYDGRRDFVNTRKSVTLMLRFITAVSAGFMVLAFLASGQIMRLYTTDARVIEKGVLYMKVSAITFLLHGWTTTLTLVLRSTREVRIPLLASIGSFFVNIFFNWVFIFGKLGAPELEIAGAALGTVIARVFEFGTVGGFFFFAEQKIHYRLRDLTMQVGDIMGVYFRYSVPVMFSDLLLGTGNSMVSVVIGHLGTSFVAANSVVAMIQRLSSVMTQGLAQASAVITGNRIGRGERTQAIAEARTMIVLSCLLGLVTGGIILWIGPYIIGTYRISEETKEIAFQLLWAISIMVVFQAMQSTLTKGILRGGGDTRFCVIADAGFLWLVSIPLGWVCGVQWGASAFLTYICLKLDWTIKVFVCLWRFKTGLWIRKV